MQIRCIYCLICCSLWIAGLAQDTTLTRKSSFRGVPLVFYLPETNWSFGGAGVYSFYTHQELPSQINFGLAYTINRQFLAYLPFRLYNRQKDVVYGELGYYIYNYFFFGVGNDNPLHFREVYGVRYPRVRLNLLKFLGKDWYAGVRYSFDDFRINDLDSSGQLIKGYITGSFGGKISGLGLVANYDSRNNLFFPSKGFFVEILFQPFHTFLGSDFNFQRLSINASRYFAWRNNVWAFNLLTDCTFGDTPFFQMAVLGGSRNMRGYYEGRFRDKNMVALQAEWRSGFWRKIGFVIFAGYGSVFANNNDLLLRNFQYAVGTGLRYQINPKEKINIRLDFGFTRQSQAFYFTIGEAF